SELTPKQRKVAIFSSVAAVALIVFGVLMALRGGSDVAGRTAADGADAPVTEPAAPPVPVVAPRLAEAPPAPAPPPSIAPSAASPDRELDEEQKKKDKKKRMGQQAPGGPAATPDYGI